MPDGLQCMTLNAETATFKGWQRMSGHHHKHLKEALDGSDTYLAFGLMEDRTPVALALLSFIPFVGKAEIEHLSLVDSSSNLELRLKVLALLEENVKKLEARILVYTWDGNQLAAVGPALENLGWHAPKILLKRHTLNVKELDLPWIKETTTLPKGMELFSWQDLREQEQSAIDVGVEQGVFSRDIYPFDADSQPEPVNSVGLRIDNTVVGWMVTHRTDQDTIAYSALYLHRQWRNQRLALALVREAIQRHLDSGIPYALWETNPERVAPTWQRFIQDNFEPYALSEQKILLSWKALD